eukprot:2166459-Pyramimonas_sp.AAC.1
MLTRFFWPPEMPRFSTVPTMDDDSPVSCSVPICTPAPHAALQQQQKLKYHIGTSNGEEQQQH